MKSIYAIAFSFVVVAPVYAGERLSAEELKAFYTNKTVSGVHFKMGSGMLYYDPNGSVTRKSADGKLRLGKWWVDESTDKRCIRWNDMNKDLCHFVERNTDGSHTLVHGKSGKTLVEIESTVEGNAL